MNFIKQKGFFIAFVLVFLLSLGYMASIFILILIGGKTQGIVTHKTFDKKRANVTVEYQVDGNDYSFKRLYGRNVLLSVDKKVTVFYPKDDPAKGKIINDLSIVPFICLVSGFVAYVMRPEKKKGVTDNE